VGSISTCFRRTGRCSPGICWFFVDRVGAGSHIYLHFQRGRAIFCIRESPVPDSTCAKKLLLHYGFNFLWTVVFFLSKKNIPRLRVAPALTFDMKFNKGSRDSFVGSYPPGERRSQKIPAIYWLRQEARRSRAAIMGVWGLRPQRVQGRALALLRLLPSRILAPRGRALGTNRGRTPQTPLISVSAGPDLRHG